MFGFSSLSRLVVEAIRYVAASPQSRIRQRAALRALDERLLTDVGITPDEARRGRPAGHAASAKDRPDRTRGAAAPQLVR